MRTLYVLGLVVLDVVILLLGAVVIAITDLDKESGLGSLRTLPTLLLVLPHFTVAHYALSVRGNEDEEVRRTSRRTTMILAGSFAGAGAVLLIGLTAAFHGPLAIAILCSGLGGATLAYALLVGEKAAARYRVHHPDAAHLRVDDAEFTPARTRTWSLLALAVAAAAFVVSLAAFRSAFSTRDFVAAAGLAALVGGLLGCLVTIAYTWRSSREVRRLNAANLGSRHGIPTAISSGKFDRIRPQDEPEAVRYARRLTVLLPASATGLALLFGGVYGLLAAVVGSDGLSSRSLLNLGIALGAGIAMAVLIARQNRNARRYLALHAPEPVEQHH